MMPSPALKNTDRIAMNRTDTPGQTVEAQPQIGKTEAPSQPDPSPMNEANAETVYATDYKSGTYQREAHAERP